MLKCCNRTLNSETVVRQCCATPVISYAFSLSASASNDQLLRKTAQSVVVKVVASYLHANAQCHRQKLTSTLFPLPLQPPTLFCCSALGGSKCGASSRATPHAAPTARMFVHKHQTNTHARTHAFIQDPATCFDFLSECECVGGGE